VIAVVKSSRNSFRNSSHTFFLRLFAFLVNELYTTQKANSNNGSCPIIEDLFSHLLVDIVEDYRNGRYVNDIPHPIKVYFQNCVTQQIPDFFHYYTTFPYGTTSLSIHMLMYDVAAMLIRFKHAK
jgi:hypothetical protein